MKLCTWALLRISTSHFSDSSSADSFGNFRLNKSLQKSASVLPEPFGHRLLQNKVNPIKFLICSSKKAEHYSFRLATCTFKRLSVLSIPSFSKILHKTREKLLSMTLKIKTDLLKSKLIKLFN